MATIGGSNIVRSGLVLHLDAANPKSYVNGSTSWFDLSGNGNTGTLTNGPTFNSANGGSIVFDGVNDYTSTTALFNINSATWCAWIRPDNLGLSGLYSRRILHQSDNSGNREINLSHSNGNIVWYGYGASSYIWNLTSLSININMWHHVVGTYDGSYAYLYVNGLLKANTSYTGTVGTATVPLSIGKVGFSNIGYYSGHISNILIHNRALTASEVLQNYNATKSRFNL
jgi:hypothetical protein